MRRLGIVAALCAAGLWLPAPAAAIVGGEPAQQELGFLTQLYVKGDDGRFSFACGASLVRPGWALTAAHCVEGRSTGDLQVFLGRRRLSAGGGESPPVAEVRVPPGYAASDGRTHDVALLRLGADAGAAPVRIVSLEERPVWAPGVRAFVVGWGTTFSGGPPSDELREVRVPIQSDGTCELTVGPTVGYDRVTNLCAGETTGGGDSCQGDSGGPLLAPDAGGRLVLVGVVSFGLGCANPTQFGVYSRVGDRELSGFLAANLPAEGAPPTAGAGGPGGSGPGADRLTGRLSYSARLGSARAARRRRAIRLRVRTTAPLTRVTATLRRDGRTVARGTRASLNDRAVLRLRLRSRGRLRVGALRLALTGHDAEGRTVRRSGRAVLSR